MFFSVCVSACMSRSRHAVYQGGWLIARTVDGMPPACHLNCWRPGVVLSRQERVVAAACMACRWLCGQLVMRTRVVLWALARADLPVVRLVILQQQQLCSFLLTCFCR
jgi:hypothetical protein